MLTAGRAFDYSAGSEPELPQVKEFQPLYDWGLKPRRGQVIMVAGRPGSGKSGFALFWVAQMNLPTLYFSADMTPNEASSRLVQMEHKLTDRQVEAKAFADRQALLKPLLEKSKISFDFGSPIKFNTIVTNLEAYAELHDAYPEVLVIDNLMDVEGCESDYTNQMAAVQDLVAMARDYGVTVIILHHASDKTGDARTAPGLPPARSDIKNGMGEKPQITLTVALEPITNTFRIGVVKQRSGKSDPSAQQYIELLALPDYCRFEPKHETWRGMKA